MMDFELAKAEILELIQKDGLTAPDEKVFTSLVLENEDAAKEVYRSTGGKPGHPLRYKIVTALTNVCRGEDIAREESLALVNRRKFRDCTTEEETAFRAWLLCQTDEKPASMPMEVYVAGFFSRPQYRTICYISKVSEFPARLCVYGMARGYIELFKDTLQQILAEFGIDYARNFINQLVCRYQVPESDLMVMASVIYAGPAKQKLEVQLYREYIDGWVNRDRAGFLASLSATLGGKDWHGKVLKKFEKEGL